MKRIILLMISAAVLMTGCTTKRKNFIILIDPSISVPKAVQDKYIETIQETILPQMVEHDKLTVLFIDECSQTKAERIYTLDLAIKDFANSRDGINNSDDSIKARRIDFIANTVKAEIAFAITEKRKERKACNQFTDIVNALSKAETLIELKKGFSSNAQRTLNAVSGDENYVYENCIIIFSDMINENPEHTLDFTEMPYFSEQQVRKKIAFLKSNYKTPDFKNVNVIVYGTTAGKGIKKYANKQIENIKLFWSEYFKCTGANLIAYDYDTRREIEEYVLAER